METIVSYWFSLRVWRGVFGLGFFFFFSRLQLKQQPKQQQKRQLRLLPIVYILHISCAAVPRGTCSDGEDASPLAIRSNRRSVSQYAWGLISVEMAAYCPSETPRYWEPAFAGELVSPWSEPPLLLWTHGDSLTNVRVGILNHINDDDRRTHE